MNEKPLWIQLDEIVEGWQQQGYIVAFALLDVTALPGRRIQSVYVVKSVDGKESRVDFTIGSDIPIEVQAKDNLNILLQLWAVRA